MAENNRETKSAILGELESIKDLLRDQELHDQEQRLLNDEREEPPVLTNEIEAFDIPLLDTPTDPGTILAITPLPQKRHLTPLQSGPSSRQQSLLAAHHDTHKNPNPSHKPSDPDSPDSDPLTELSKLSDELNELSATINEPLTAPSPLGGKRAAVESGHPTPEKPAPQQPPASKKAPENGDPLQQTRQTQPPARHSAVENPFLPKHIRDRLHTHKSLIDEIKDCPSYTGAVPPAPTYATGALIEELVNEFMPKIEAELRQRLGKMIHAPLLYTHPAPAAPLEVADSRISADRPAALRENIPYREDAKEPICAEKSPQTATKNPQSAQKELPISGNVLQSPSKKEV